MFFGQVQLTMDEKGRIVLPAVFRDQMHGPLFFALGDVNEIAIWPEEGFNEKFAEKQERERTEGPAGAREFRRFTANAAPVKMDAQFRIAIPENLRLKGRLARDLTMVGAGGRVEIWDTRAFAEYLGDES